ncbi:MAG TPA: hypothetical protein VMS04_16775 [Vicinamibacterales bacterium]|nr:hypothetical protein [Vicinamibacterales bacterium]
MRSAVGFLVVMVLVGGARVAAAPGRGHVTLAGDVNASFDIEVNGCVAMRPGDSVMDGFMFTIVHNEMIATGVIQVPGYGGEKTYERTPANDRVVRLSLQIHKSARDSKIYDVDVREKSPGVVKATVSEDGRTGSATFEDVDLGYSGKKEGKVSGSITWECASVLVL